MSNNRQDSGYVVRTLRTLELLVERPLSQAEVARNLDAHPRTVRRLLARLVAEGYATRLESDPRLYTSTLRVVWLAGRALGRLDIVRLAPTYVTKLRDLTGETSELAIPGQDSALQLLYESGSGPIVAKRRLGEQVPYHATAVGKGLLAHLPAQVDQLLERGLERFTERTLIEAGELLIDLATVRERGYAIDDLEHSNELRCVAAPVFDYAGHVVGALGVSGPATRLTMSTVPETAKIVVSVARELSETLGAATLEVQAVPGAS